MLKIETTAQVPELTSLVSSLANHSVDKSQIMIPTRQKRTYSMTTRLRFTIALLLIVAAVAVVGIWLAREVSIDKCLDCGGAWDYDLARCLVTTH
jgi:hypothetical protein